MASGTLHVSPNLGCFVNFKGHNLHWEGRLILAVWLWRLESGGCVRQDSGDRNLKTPIRVKLRAEGLACLICRPQEELLGI